MNSIKQYFQEHYFAKFALAAFVFTWFTALLGALWFVHTGFVIASGLTAAALGIGGIISACIQYD